MSYLIDTNILSETIKPKPDKNVVAWLESVPQHTLYVSVLTLGEIQKGIALLSMGQKRQTLEYWLEHELTKWFGANIVSINSEIAFQWGVLTTLKPPMPAVDCLIAATALTHNFTLVTRNVRDFEMVPNLRVLNPFLEH